MFGEVREEREVNDVGILSMFEILRGVSHTEAANYCANRAAYYLCCSLCFSNSTIISVVNDTLLKVNQLIILVKPISMLKSCTFMLMLLFWGNLLTVALCLYETDVGEACSSVGGQHCQGRNLITVSVLSFLGWTVCTVACWLLPVSCCFQVSLFNTLQKQLIC